ncbi:UbiA family prenyltransferase [Extensimonas vulgaris]|uniref:4-hydroxybenzoate polyprenyltransferase n=1 Tax=Extensimonas vulgaris TaxID=1031594 RepID=A0A369APJ1_9BURK|nr:UbiA family prenyltransferase [Extensimonas vulgaris]RCX09374.1 4-hydroxybenzoate polyprenyltransferase [Extensimonas vulgaris]TWI38505.1 4-hydroxybenzoate polyprenyltransferase [Extensimonas vulgaris]TXD13565.1 UbiA family prenyltransferase [Extensimonas vulgaris]
MNIPLVIDLDGTLIHTDMLHESTLRLVRDAPLQLLRLPFLLARGKAVLKRHIAQRSSFDPAALPYNQPLLEWLQSQRAAGRKLVLCTATDATIAQAIADHLGLFDEVIASDGSTNVAGAHKAQALRERFGQGGFDYAGNAAPDLPVWAQARKAIVVNGNAALVQKAQGIAEVEHVFPPQPAGISTLRRMLRVHQWLKNLLLFVPLLAAHQLGNGPAWLALLLAFASFSLCASSVYIANDLLDLESDRLHPRKRLRPFASGQMPVWQGVVFAPLLLLASLLLATFVGGQFLPWLLAYFVLTCAYSWGLKRLVLVDCLTLALLYTLRIVAGAAAVGQALSFWLLAFSVFLFLSLAFVKRYAELEVQVLSGKQKIHGRGYHTTDAPIVQTMGIVSGYASVLVLALYLNSDAVLRLYRAPQVIWGAVPVMLFWVSWMWLQAQRGQMHDDPLVFAVKDRASLAAGVAFVAIIAAGAVGWPW